MIYAGGTSGARHSILEDNIGFTKAYPSFIYLGVHIFVGRPKAFYFNHIVDNIKVKLANWKAKVLSMVGRIQLVKSTILSMLIHYLSIYHWSGSIVKMIEKWLRNFIWSGNRDIKKTVTVAWKTCCIKQNEGGLGILSLKDYNSTTDLHQLWKFINDTQCWTKMLKARVLRNGRLIKYATKSFIWQGIKGAHGYVMESCVWRIGYGKRVNFWIEIG